jgi:hypothetical protein
MMVYTSLKMYVLPPQNDVFNQTLRLSPSQAYLDKGKNGFMVCKFRFRVSDNISRLTGRNFWRVDYRFIADERWAASATTKPI